MVLPFVAEVVNAAGCVTVELESTLPAARASGVVRLEETARVALLRPGFSGGDSCADVPPPVTVGGVVLR